MSTNPRYHISHLLSATEIMHAVDEVAYRCYTEPRIPGKWDKAYIWENW